MLERKLTESLAVLRRVADHDGKPQPVVRALLENFPRKTTAKIEELAIEV